LQARATNGHDLHYLSMQVSEIMTREVETATPDTSLQQVASTMEALGVGSLPVCDGNRLVGTITDRDIVVRAVAAGLSPVDTLVRDCMTEDIVYAFCDEEAEEVLERMKTQQIRRLAILDRDKSLMGFVSLGDVATEPRAAALASVGSAISGISEPSRPRK
jgi:CBS domain-containing protein